MKLNVNLKLVLVILPAFILAACGGGGGGGNNNDAAAGNETTNNGGAGSETGNSGGGTGSEAVKEVRNFIPPKCPLRPNDPGVPKLSANAADAECLRGTYSGILDNDGRSCSIDFMGAAGFKFTVAGNSAVYTPSKNHVPEFRYVNYLITPQSPEGANQAMKALYVYEIQDGRSTNTSATLFFSLKNGTADRHTIKMRLTNSIAHDMNINDQPICAINKVAFQ